MNVWPEQKFRLFSVCKFWTLFEGHEPSVLIANCINRKLYKKASELFDLFDFEQLISHPYLKSGPLFAEDILNLATKEAELFVEKFFEHLRKKTLGLDTLKTLARATFKNSGKFSVNTKMKCKMI